MSRDIVMRVETTGSSCEVPRAIGTNVTGPCRRSCSDAVENAPIQTGIESRITSVLP